MTEAPDRHRDRDRDSDRDSDGDRDRDRDSDGDRDRVSDRDGDRDRYAELFADPVDVHPLVVAARALADGVLAPSAAAVDAAAVPPSHLAALGAAGLLGLEAPARVGGAQAPAAVGRRVNEVLAGADLTTWFVQVQHHGPVRALAAAGPRFDPVLGRLAAGELVAGIAFSHLRHWPRRPVTATPHPGGGWRLDGVAPWYTGWGLNDVALVAGAADPEADDPGADDPGADGGRGAGRAVFALVPARPSSSLRASAPLDVAALRGAATVTLTLDGLVVPPADVVSVEPIAGWLAADAARTANLTPAVLGLTESALRLLIDEGVRRHEPAAVDAALRLAARWRAVRAEAYHLLDDVEPGERAADRLRLRVRGHQLLVESTTALVIAGAGRSMALDSPAQRKAREGLFLLVQAQTVASRTANLEAVAAGQPTGPV